MTVFAAFPRLKGLGVSKYLLFFTLIAGPASAEPFSAFIFTSLATAGVSVGVASAIAAAITNFAISAVLSIGSKILFKPKAPSSPEVINELARPSDRIAYRFVYGNREAPGSYAPGLVKGNILWACCILNSRPSEGNFTVYFDNREVEVTGDLYDFTEGGGATATNDPFAGYLKMWIGLGDQTTPPFDVTDEAPDLFETTDGWQGKTVLWYRADIGPNSTRQERWPSFFPEVAVRGDWSKVFDPREVSHDFNDPDTWEFSRNQKLCLLDALTQNPIEPYRLANLDLDSFIDAADAADDAIDLKAGGTEPRYSVDGIIVFSEGELEDQIAPLVAAGDGQLIRMGGKLGVEPGIAQTSIYTLTDMIGSGFKFVRYKRGENLPTHLRATYINVDRNYERAELAEYEIPGAAAADGGKTRTRSINFDMVTSPTQVMRLRKIAGLTARMQKTLSCVAPPDAFVCVGGSAVTVTLPAPYAAMNDSYKVQSVSPAFDPVGDEGVALQNPINLIETSADIWAWDKDTEEEVILTDDFNADRASIAPPGEITATFDSATNTGVGYAQALHITFAPSSSAAATRYEVQYSIEGDAWAAWNTIDAYVSDGSGDVFTDIYPISLLSTYRVRVRTITATGESDWRELTGIVSTFILSTVSAVAVAGGAEFTATAPSYEAFAGVKIFRAATGAGFGAAVAVSDLMEKAAGASFTALAGDATATNEVSNGTFDSTADWTLDAGWSIGGGVLTHTSGGGLEIAEQTISVTDGETYRYQIDRVNGSGGSVLLYLVGDTNASSGALGSNTLYQGTLTAPVNTTAIQVLANSYSGDVDDVVLVLETDDLLTQGEADFWIAPVSSNGTQGPEVGPFTLTIY